MSNNPVVENLKKVLADTYALYVKTQNYHWNVTGPNFKELHVFFEELYKDQAGAIDLLAERIRGLDHKVPGSFAFYEKHKSIEDPDENLSATEMLKNLSYDYDKCHKTLMAALEVAQKHDDEVTVDIMVERMRQQEKDQWMIKSHYQD